MKRNSRHLSGWIVLVVIALSVAVIGAADRRGPLAFLYGQIEVLFAEVDQLAAESNDQQEQIDQLTGTVCGLSVLTGNPAPPELCEVVVTATCPCEHSTECACDPGPYFELESCEHERVPHPALGKVPPPKCSRVNACRGTFTRIAAGDEASVAVEAGCSSGASGGCDPGCPFCHICPCGCDFPDPDDPDLPVCRDCDEP